jgi:hypothetical protein
MPKLHPLTQTNLLKSKSETRPRGNFHQRKLRLKSGEKPGGHQNQSQELAQNDERGLRDFCNLVLFSQKLFTQKSGHLRSTRMSPKISAAFTCFRVRIFVETAWLSVKIRESVLGVGEGIYLLKLS